MSTSVVIDEQLVDGTDAVIGTNVHDLLWRRDNATQAALAAALRLTPSVMSKKLRGTSAWSARQVAVTAAFLDVEPGRLFQQPSVPKVALKVVDGSRKGGPADPTFNFLRSVPTSNTPD